jgi:gamma-glutamyl-gamma-aminobutyrate hydrolase PuuD
MRLIAVSQGVTVVASRGERRDFLDQAWTRLLAACGLTALPAPTDVDTALALCAAAPIAGVLLTGGNNLAAYGGDAPERDATEAALIDMAQEKALPVLGVCRGMQVIQHRYGIPLQPVEGHVARSQINLIEGERVEVNSYHNFGATQTRAPLEPWAFAEDGVVKAVRHPGERIIGVMWHPERLDPFAARDIELFRRFFGAA